MNCSEVQELLSAYHDGELADDMRSRVSEHLGQCSDCAQRLAGFENLSVITGLLSTPTPPTHIWSQLEQQLDQQPTIRPATLVRGWSFPVSSRFALAATILIAVGIGWFSYQNWFVPGEHRQFAAEFGHYLEEFRRDPDAAQHILLTKYRGQAVDVDQAIQQVGYRPAVADGLPDGYTVGSTYVMKMPCCTCVQTDCKREDGTTLAIFEHDDEAMTQWFGDRPGITASCHDRQCCLVELDDQIAASWKRGTRHITLIGVRDIAEVDQMVAWMDNKKGALKK
jgi:hypothetical protein